MVFLWTGSSNHWTSNRSGYNFQMTQCVKIFSVLPIQLFFMGLSHLPVCNMHKEHCCECKHWLSWRPHVHLAQLIPFREGTTACKWYKLWKHADDDWWHHWQWYCSINQSIMHLSISIVSQDWLLTVHLPNWSWMHNGNPDALQLEQVVTVTV